MGIKYTRFRIGLRRTFLLARRLEPAVSGAAYILLSLGVTSIAGMILLPISSFMKLTLIPAQEVDEELTKIVYKKQSCLSRSLKILGTIIGEGVIAVGMVVSFLVTMHLVTVPFFVAPAILLFGFSTLFLITGIAAIAALWNKTGDDRSHYILAGCLAVAMAACVVWITIGSMTGHASTLMLVVGIAFCLMSAMKLERKSIRNEELEKFRVNSCGISYANPVIVDAINLPEAQKEHRSVLANEAVYRPAPLFGYPWFDWKRRQPLSIRQRSEQSFLEDIEDRSSLLDPKLISDEEIFSDNESPKTPPVSPIKTPEVDFMHE